METGTNAMADHPSLDLAPPIASEGQAVAQNSTVAKFEAVHLDDRDDDELYISDLCINCIVEDTKNISLKLIQLIYKDKKDSGLFTLNKVSPTSWKSDSLIILPLNINRLKIYAHGEGYYKLGYLWLKKKVLDNFRKSGDSKLRVENTMKTTEDIGITIALTLSTEYSGPQKTTSSDEIALIQQVIQITPKEHSDLPRRLNNLGNSYFAQFEQSEDIIDISGAISSYQQAIQLIPKGDTDLPGLLNSLGFFFKTRFQRFGTITDISEAISFYHQGIQLTPQGDPSLPGRLSDLGDSSLIRFEHFGDITDVSKAMSLHQQVVQLTPKGHPDLPRRLNCLGKSFRNQFEYAGNNITDISEAMSLQQQAIQLTPKGHPNLPGWLSDLGNCFKARFECFGDITDISKAISLHQQAVQLTPKGHPNLPGWLNNLGNSFLAQFDHFGDITDISEAISFFQQATQLTPHGHPNLPSHFNGLGSSLRIRFERFGDPTDISEAIIFHLKSVELTPQGDSNLPSHLNNLGISFLSQFDRFGDVTDIRKATSFHQKAVEITPPGNPDLALWLNNLGLSLQIQFEHLGDIADISEAVSFHQKAVDLTSQGDPDLPSLLNNLGNSFLTRFEHSENIADISKAISFHQQAVQLTPQGHSDLSGWLTSLGNSFKTRFEQLKDTKDISEAISSYQRAATSKSGYPLTRLRAAKNWAELSRNRSASQELEAYTLVINLMSEVAGIEQTVEVRHTNLTNMSTLASCAVAAAFLHGRPDLALEWLEQGRCLVWNQINQLRTPSRNLQIKHPHLAAKFKQLSSDLVDAGSRQGLSVSSVGMKSEDVLTKNGSEDAANKHIRVAQQYNKLLEEIRSIPEFHTFLRPSSASDILAHLPKAGTVIFINVHEDRCDGLALVAGRNKPLHIPLKNFTYKQANDLRSQLSMYLSRHGLQMRTVDRGGRPVGLVKHAELILRMMWLNVVKPIFDALGFDRPESPPRRIWWCTTGPLASLPIHAAGVYRDGGTCVADFAVSSYIPNVRMLADKIKDIEEGHNSRLLLVSQAYPNPHTIKDGDKERTVTLPGIPGVDEETNKLKTLLESSDIDVLRLAGNNATISKVQKETASCQSIHLACHGTQDFKKPLQSGFFLLDGRLELSEIMKRHDPTADLAFLSACETSTGDQTLTEEAVHLAAGMLAVGYRSVVATMWSIKDDYGPGVAEDFYSELLRSRANGGKARLDGAGAAYALHYATQRLRKKVGDTDSGLLTWLPYVHFGI